jgi:hypothetical protein
MCFSAPASFTASAVLAAVGAGVLCRLKGKHLWPLALIPWFFAIQQFSEGVVWLSLSETTPTLLALVAKNVFLFFAFVFWPIWMPLSLWLVETDIWRKRLIFVCLGIGILTSLLLAFRIPHMAVMPYRCSIHYGGGLSLLQRSSLIALPILLSYGIATVLPLFLSSLKNMKILAVLVTLSGLAIYWIDQLFFVSMWCFSAAILSICLLFVRRKKQEK